MSLFEKVKDRVLECPLRGKKFLPLDALDEMITTEAVKANLRKRTRWLNSGLPGKIVQQTRKIFAILVLMKESPFINDFLALFEEGLRDEHLPLKTRKEDDSVLVSESGREFHSFRHWNPFKVNAFLEKQWIVQAPVFDLEGNHIVLDPECALPLLENFKQIGGGQASAVYKAVLHKNHQRFATQGTEVPVAVKMLNCLGEKEVESFNQERDNLERVQKLHHEHLIKHITICQGKPHSFVLFPLAEGGALSDFWKNEDSRPRNTELFSWSFRQMLGLSSALQALHELNCRHGDLKPDNILNFKNGHGEDVLVVADLGVSKIHAVATDLRKDPTRTTATTRAYESPEVFESDSEDLPRRRRFDIWSIGCIFLEFSIWLLYDNKAISCFERNREAPDHSFYKRTEGGRAIVHPKVSEAMEAVREDPRCKGGTALEDLINLIDKHLLQIKAESRYSAQQLHDRLQAIVQGAADDPSYLFRQVDPHPTTPVVFQRSESLSGQGTRIIGDTSAL
ncbi:kinase-like protein [Rhizodiscina lignyota]|uniref:Kinase-like protein n=1 Tax=Rhizodiscina lignyota TaxID=1504668 RepID=A0A9P4MBY6_9PEZI|nr:kinase-like protein [Rhizodiscina lignyota]